MYRVLLAALLATGGCAHEEAAGRPWVHKVTFSGTRHVDPGKLLDKLAIEQTSWLPLAPKHYLDPFTLQLDRRRIESYYHARGFFRAKVTSVKLEPRDKNDPPKSVDVRIVLEEGAVSKIAEVKLSGLDAFGGVDGPISGGFNIKRGDPLDSEKLTTWTDHILEQLKAGGYAWAKVEGGADVDRDSGVAHVHVEVVAGPRVTVGRVTWAGDTTLVSARQLEIHSALVAGMLATPEALEEARGKLYALGVFSLVKVEIVAIAEHPDQAEIVINLHAGPLRELRLGAGFGIDFQRNEVRLKGTYTKRNFLGGLRTLRLNLQPAYVVIPAIWNVERHGPAGLAELQFTQPDLWAPHLDLEARVSYELGVDYAYQYHGPKFHLGLLRPFFHERLHLGISYNFQLLLFFNTDPAILNDPARAQRLFGYTDPYRLAWLQQDISLDFRDHPIDARRGVLLSLTAEEGGNYTGSAFQYEKLMPEVRGYLPLGSRVVVAARVKFGQMFVQGDSGSPITRRFHLGGADSHRGFGYDRLSPQVPSGFAGVSPLPIGGDQMVLGQLEVRVNLFTLAGSWLEAAAFLDTGDVAGPACQSTAAGASACAALGPVSDRVNLTKLHYATGGGLRYRTVIGTIRADLGVRLNRLAAMEADGTPNPDPDSRIAFHLSLGEPF